MVLSRASGQRSTAGGYSHEVLEPVFAQRYMKEPLIRKQIPENELSREAAFQIVADTLQVDGKPRLNLASFVTTWMEPEAEKLMKQCLSKNAIDLAEYPAYAHIQEECVNMIARLFHAPLGDEEEAVGTATIGSSEALMLAALALKRTWQHFRRKHGLSIDRPNLVVAANTHVVVDKFANYFEVELRKVPVTREQPYMRPEHAAALCDERTIGVVSVFGSTYTGHFEHVDHLGSVLEELDLPHGWEVPIHVDAASGGFVAPFLYPEVKWDFRVPRVVSINASGHKYGLTYAGVGWVLWRSHERLPEDLVFHVNYLGEDQPTYTLNFSRGASQVVAQYYQFLRLGFSGYKRVMEHCATVADKLRDLLELTGYFDIISDADVGLPLVAFTFKKDGPIAGLSEEELSADLRRHSWMVPAYTMPLQGGKRLSLMRVCVREELSMGLADWLVRDLVQTVERILAHQRRDDKVVAVLSKAASQAADVDKTSEVEEKQKLAVPAKTVKGVAPGSVVLQLEAEDEAEADAAAAAAARPATSAEGASEGLGIIGKEDLPKGLREREHRRMTFTVC